MAPKSCNCEICGNTGHSGNSYLETQVEDVNLVINGINNGLHPQQGWNSSLNLPCKNQQLGNSNDSFQTSIRDLVVVIPKEHK
jgi:hypothetical protein